MQLFALDETGQLVLAAQALRQKDYICRECQQAVRVRRGAHKRAHFFHNEPLRTCSQHGKSLEHLQIQHRIEHALLQQCTLEQRFEEIGRIADVCWEKEKIIFEIQCSAISVREVKKRTSDYERLGYTVIWILHDHYFGQPSIKAPEEWLHGRLCFFTNIDQEGKGYFYDRCSLIVHGQRRNIGPFLPIEITEPLPKPALTGNLPHILRNRIQQTSFCFRGDLFHAPRTLLEEAHRIETRLERYQWLRKCQQVLSRYLLRPYEALMRLMLEKYCG